MLLSKKQKLKLLQRWLFIYGFNAADLILNPDTSLGQPKQTQALAGASNIKYSFRHGNNTVSNGKHNKLQEKAARYGADLQALGE